MPPLPYRQIHLDFHTSEQIAGIGARFDAAAFARRLQEARVNSITCFSKCHHGMIYHDTRFAQARHPYLEVNLLQEQIQACHAAGIRVPIYISVGFDELVAREHPEWVELMADGKVRGGGPLEAGWRNLCFNTPYIDYVSEQTQEVLSLFETDGLFFDIIHQGPCCCRFCLAGMCEQGLDPEAEADRKAFAFQVREAMKRRITDEIRAVNQNCLIFWNSGHVDPTFRRSLDTYSHLELESLPSGGWGYDHYPLTVRYARNLGLDHLGMTGKFIKTWAGFGEYKNQAALEYEAFTALAEGSKVSIGDQLPPHGELDEATYELIGAVYQQVEAKEPWCAGARAVTELAIYNPEELGVHDGRVDTAAGGAYRMLVEAHYQFDVVDSEMDWSGYRVVVLPDKIRLPEWLQTKVQDYLAGGGKVIASHRSGLAAGREEFVLPELGVRYLAEGRYSPDYVKPGEALSAGVLRAEHVLFDRGLEVEPLAGAEPLAEVWHPYFDRTYAHFCSHRHTPVEKASGLPAVVATESTVYFAHPIFSSFMRHGVRTYKLLFLNALQRLLADKLVETNAPTTAHVSLAVQSVDGTERTIAHVLHYVPEQRYREIQTIEEALPLHGVELAVRLAAAPGRVYLAPEGADLPFTYTEGRARVTVPRVDGHAMVVFE
ncbi:MAG: Beta-galactosidase trimerization domain protein [Armatimonadetes bacterium]|nr:Beta-galactosidase trimerization domain protein [Armatimonadota bacterium]